MISDVAKLQMSQLEKSRGKAGWIRPADDRKRSAKKEKPQPPAVACAGTPPDESDLITSLGLLAGFHLKTALSYRWMEARR